MSFEPRIEILPLEQRGLWPSLRGLTRFGFVLYGGTAIALRLGHRASVDFDFFSNASLDRERLFNALPFLKTAAVLQDYHDTVTLEAPVQDAKFVKLSFFGNLHLGRVGVPDMTADGVLEVASLDDLMAMKVATILRRIEAKDYMDVAAMVRAGVPLERGLGGARAIYGSSFQPSESLKALAYFEGGDLQALSQNDRDTLMRAVASVRDIPSVILASQRLSAQGASD